MTQFTKEQAEFVKQLTTIQSDLRMFCAMLLPGQIHEVDDVVQEANRVLLEKSTEFAAGTDFRAWAFTVARFQVLAFLQRRSRSKLVMDSELITTLAVEASDTIDLNQVRRAMLSKCLDEFPDKDRQLLEIRYSRRQTLQEYSAACGRSVAGLKKSLIRLRTLLRNCIDRRMLADETSI